MNRKQKLVYLLVLVFTLTSPLPTFAKTKPRSGSVEGVVVKVLEPWHIIMIESNELIPKTSTKLRYMFELSSKDHCALIDGYSTINKVGTMLKIDYIDLHLSEMDYFYEGKATKIVEMKGKKNQR